MHTAKVITIKPFRLQPFTEDLATKHDQLVTGLIEVFSNNEVTRHNPRRRIKTYQEAGQKLFDSLNDYESEMSYDYFLFDLEKDKMIGLVCAISPKGIKHAYPILPLLPSIRDDNANIWMLEYYLHPAYWNLGIMTVFCGTLMNNLFDQGASLVTALIGTDNLPSEKLLQKLLFEKNAEYKDMQDQNLFTRNKPIGLQLN